MLTKTNKLTALIIAIMVMMNLVIATVPAMASATFKQAVFEDFEDETTAFFLDGATNSQDYVTFSDNPINSSLIYGKSMKFDLSNAPVGTYYYDMRANSYVPSNVPANYYAEASFDIAMNLSDRPIYLYFRNNDNGKALFTLHWSTDKKFYIIDEKGAQKVGYYNYNQMYNIKVVQHWTGADGEIVRCTNGVYVDGNLVDTTNVSFPKKFQNSEEVGKCNVIRLECTQKTANKPNIVYMDNLSYVTYISEDGTSPVADFSALKNAITEGTALLGNTAYAEADRDVFRQAILEALKTYKVPQSSQEIVNNALANLKNAKFELRKMNDEYVYNEDFSDATLWSNLSASGNYSITDYDADAQSGLYGNAAKVTVNSASTTVFEVKPNSGTLTNNVDGTKLASVSFDFKPWGLFKDMSMTVKIGGEKDNSNVFQMNFASQGTLNISTLRSNNMSIYPGGTTTPVTSALCVAEGIDYSKMHNIMIVYGADEAGLGYPFTSIKGIYLDGQKLDYVDTTKGTIYPLAMPQTRMNTVRFEISNRSAQYEQYGYWVDNVKATLHTDGVLPVSKANLKAAINEIESIYNSLNDTVKAAVTAKLNEAKAMYNGNTYGQVACDDMAVQLLKSMLPALSDLAVNIRIPQTIATSKLVCPDYSNSGVTVVYSSEPAGYVAEDGTVSLPVDGPVTVRVSATLSREGEEDYVKAVDNVTILPVVPVEINEIEFKDENGNTVYGPSDNGKLASVTVKMNKALSEAKLYSAVYENEILEACKVSDVVDGEVELNIDVTADSEVKFFVWSNSFIPLQSALNATAKERKLIIMGDSIYAEAPTNLIYEGQYGIGKVLGDIYGNVVNKAYCGEGSKGYTEIFDDYSLNATLPLISSGDIVLISFAHNDQKSWENGYAPIDYTDGSIEAENFEVGSYQYYISRIISEVRSKGGIPVVLTAVPRASFDNDVLINTHGDYIEAMKTIAQSMNVLCIDLNTYGHQNINYSNYQTYFNFNDVISDTTHLSRAGAELYANYIKTQLDALFMPIQ